MARGRFAIAVVLSIFAIVSGEPEPYDIIDVHMEESKFYIVVVPLKYVTRAHCGGAGTPDSFDARRQWEESAASARMHLSST